MGVEHPAEPSDLPAPRNAGHRTSPGQTRNSPTRSRVATPPHRLPTNRGDRYLTHPGTPGGPNRRPGPAVAGRKPADQPPCTIRADQRHRVAGIIVITLGVVLSIGLLVGGLLAFAVGHGRAEDPNRAHQPGGPSGRTAVDFAGEIGRDEVLLEL